MNRPAAHRLFFLLALAALASVACGTAYRYTSGALSDMVSGHVTFPKRAVRAVFERMEKDLSLPGQAPPALMPRNVPRGGGAPGLKQASAPGCPSVSPWWPVGVACAQETREASFPSDPERALFEELHRMIEVREALLSRRQREALILEWKKKGLIGEARDGLIVFLRERRQVDREILARVANENDDRLIIMRAMAKAVVAINGVNPVEKIVSSQMEGTKREFTAVRRRLSPLGTWVQLPDGQWVQK